MKLYLVQHGTPNPKQEDPERHLSEKGVSDVKAVARFIEPLGLSVSALWHSGKARAAETADLLAESVQAGQGVIRREGLAPMDPVGPVVDAIGEMAEDLIIAGHLPFLGKLVAVVVAGSESADVVAFQQGGIVCLERDEDRNWTVRWMVTPDLLR